MNNQQIITSVPLAPSPYKVNGYQLLMPCESCTPGALPAGTLLDTAPLCAKYRLVVNTAQAVFVAALEDE